MQGDPIGKWREQYARCCINVDFEPLSDVTFQASVKPIFTEPHMAQVAFSPGFVFRDEDLIRDGNDSIGLIIAQSGNPTFRHLEREIRLGSGDATMMLANATGGLGSREHFRYCDMLIPPSEWEARGARPQDGLMQRLWGKSQAMELLRGYIRFLEKGIGLAASVDDHTVFRKHLVDLAVLATTARCPIGESSASAVMAARRSAALDYIASHFSDPELSLNNVARSRGISRRYLQKILETAGISFASHVNELRLKRAYMLLTDQPGGKARISDIVFQSGFSDISYFNRRFRSRFGHSPSDVRAQARPSLNRSEKAPCSVHASA